MNCALFKRFIYSIFFLAKVIVKFLAKLLFQGVVFVKPLVVSEALLVLDELCIFIVFIKAVWQLLHLLREINYTQLNFLQPLNLLSSH